MEMDSFCENYNEEFKLYYYYLNDPKYVNLFIQGISHLKHPRIVELLKRKIKENRKHILENIKKINTIIKYYKQNKFISNSEMGTFFKYYESELKKVNYKKEEDILKLFYKLIYYPDIISALKEAFYIFSDYRACIYYMTPSIDFYNSKKEIVMKVVESFRDNLNTMNQIISRVYIGSSNPWGSIYYASAFSMYETLYILHLYFEDPLSLCNIHFTFKKRYKKDKDVLLHIKEQSNKYNIYLHTEPTFSSILIAFKKKGYDLWFTIPFLFESIYSEYEFKNIPVALIFDSKKRISQQRNNNMLGVMIYILSINGYISNVNLLKRFND